MQVYERRFWGGSLRSGGLGLLAFTGLVLEVLANRAYQKGVIIPLRYIVLGMNLILITTIYSPLVVSVFLSLQVFVVPLEVQLVY